MAPPALSAAEVQEVVDEGRRRFVASFPSRFEVLTVMIDAADSGNPDALVGLQQTAHRLVGRAGATQFLRVGQLAAALETLATPEPGASFDEPAASRLLAEIWSAFTEERTTVASKAPAATIPIEARQTVLIADDDEDQHFLMSRLLHRAGFKVAVVTKGAEVFAQAQANKPAVILLDVQMPDQDGFTTARQLKGHPDTAGIPLMFLTGRSTVDDRLAGLRIGADDYVSKSVDPRELVLRVQKLCNRLPAPHATPATAPAAQPAAQPATGGTPAPDAPAPVVSRPPDRPWLTDDAFRDRVRDLAMRTWGALILLRAPSQSVPVGQWLAEQLRRRDLVGETDGGGWALFLPEETSSGLAPRLTDLLDRLRVAIAAPVAAGLAGSTAPGASFDTLYEQADQALAHARSRGQLLVEFSHAGAAGASPMVLLTDDDPEVTRITDAHVRAGGYRTSLAFDGEAALRAIRELKPDAIVLDLMLPKRTGFDVLAELRQMPAPRPSVLVLSARGREEDVTRAFALGADDYMIKPFSPQELIARLGRLLRVIVAAVCVALLVTSAPPGSSSEPDVAPADTRQLTAQTAAQPRVTYEDAERMARGGDTLRALEAFQALAAANPDDFDSRVWLGRLLTRVGRRAEAIELLRDVITRSPRQVDARVALGAALLTSGRVEDAYAVAQDAEALAPDSADVLALKGRILRHLGRPSEAYVALDAAHTLSPRDEDITIVRERTRRMIAHRAHVSVAQEASEEIPEATIVDADVDLHLDDTVRVFGRVQWQARAGFDDARGGGGVEWRLSRRVVGRGALLISPGSLRLARADAGGEVEVAAGRTQTTFGLRYLDFAGARVWIVAPAISIDVNDNVALAVRYYRSESEFRPFGRRAGNDSGAILARWQAARRLSLGAAYARGNESFDIVSVDRLGRFRADTVAGGVRLDLRSLTSVAVGVEHQWRSGDRQLTRVTVDFVQHF